MTTKADNNLINLNPSRVVHRRIKVFGLMIISTVLASIKWILSIPSDSALGTKILMTLLFILTFAWIALFFWSSVFGFFELWRKRKVPGIEWLPEDAPLTAKTAILMPVYNESPVDVFANLSAMAESLHQAGEGRHFDIFVLSDTTQPRVWVEEEKVWFETKKTMIATINIARGIILVHIVLFLITPLKIRVALFSITIELIVSTNFLPLPVAFFINSE